MATEKILLSHGSGGGLMHNLIRGLFLEKLNNPVLGRLSDSALIDYKEKLAFTTDSFVVSPLKFPGSDIGKLAVCGTVNDLVVAGAVPEYLSVGFIIEEGLDYKVLEETVESLAGAAKKSKVMVACGDTKVVERGACDKLFINTSGIGRIVAQRIPAIENIRAGDAIIITGNIAQHGLAVLSQRKGLDLGFEIKSDCASLDSLLIPILRKTAAIRFMRDPTRGGVATTLNEIAQSGKFGIAIEEKAIPIYSKVRVAAELLGIDPLYVANEGIAVLVVEKRGAARILGLLKKHPLGRNARIIGEVLSRPKGQVVLYTLAGTSRIVDMLSSDPLPRIC